MQPCHILEQNSCQFNPSELTTTFTRADIHIVARFVRVKKLSILKTDENRHD